MPSSALPPRAIPTLPLGSFAFLSNAGSEVGLCNSSGILSHSKWLAQPGGFSKEAT